MFQRCALDAVPEEEMAPLQQFVHPQLDRRIPGEHEGGERPAPQRERSILFGYSVEAVQYSVVPVVDCAICFLSFRVVAFWIGLHRFLLVVLSFGSVCVGFSLVLLGFRWCCCALVRFSFAFPAFCLFSFLFI